MVLDFIVLLVLVCARLGGDCDVFGDEVAWTLDSHHDGGGGEPDEGEHDEGEYDAQDYLGDDEQRVDAWTTDDNRDHHGWNQTQQTSYESSEERLKDN